MPIMDIKKKFGLLNDANSTDKVIIQIQIEDISMGIVADNVSEVVNISAENIDCTPYMGENINTEYILGIDKTQKNVKILLNIEKIINCKELVSLTDVTVEKNVELLTA